MACFRYVWPALAHEKRKRMGIEPTSDALTPLNGFEDRGGHQTSKLFPVSGVRKDADTIDGTGTAWYFELSVGWNFRIPEV